MGKGFKVGTCPICETIIYASQKTTWVLFNGVTSRIHQGCNICQDCGQTTGPNHFRDTGGAIELPAGSCPVLFERRNRNAHHTDR